MAVLFCQDLAEINIRNKLVRFGYKNRVLGSCKVINTKFKLVHQNERISGNFVAVNSSKQFLCMVIKSHIFLPHL